MLRLTMFSVTFASNKKGYFSQEVIHICCNPEDITLQGSENTGRMFGTDQMIGVLDR